LDELDYGIYQSVVGCTISELQCEFTKQWGFSPNMSATNIYDQNDLKSESKTYKDVYTYEEKSTWTGDKYTYSNVIIAKPPEGYENTKIGNGRAGIKQKIHIVDNGRDNCTAALTVGVACDDAIAVVETAMSTFQSRVEANYNKTKSYIYGMINKATAGWTEDQKASAIHAIKWNYADHRLEGMCEKKYFGSERLDINTGGAEGEEPESEGTEIVVEASKEGYISESRALSEKEEWVSELTFTGKILDKEGTPIDSAFVEIRGKNASTYTKKDGSFKIVTDLGGESPYAESMDIKLQQIIIEVSNEELGKYDGEHFGIVSDGFTTLKLKVKTKGIRPQTVTLGSPPLGDWVEQSSLKIPLVLNSQGEGEMEYVPPAYLKKSDLNRRIRLEGKSSGAYGLLTRLYAAEVPIRFSYEDEDGNRGSYKMKILVCRPPIMLVHGFTGNETTLEKLAVHLRKEKYDPIIREYYRGPADESTIERQSEKLGFYIQKLRDAYKDIGILQTRVDIVAHSMGGLISRYYISNMSKYGKNVGMAIPYNVRLSREELAKGRHQKAVKLIDVRKLIMVGTPNHGASKIDERIGGLGALEADYHQLANAQLKYDSEFLKKLNAGESEGRHLDANVQYALLHGIRRRSKLYPPDLLWYPVKTYDRALAEGDGVVATSSALLNGVVAFPFPDTEGAPYGFIHSTASVLKTAFYGDACITEDDDIYKKVEELLLQDIPRLPLANSYAKIIRSDGTVSMRYFSNKSWEPVAAPLVQKLDNYWCHLKTEEGSVSLGFFLNGHHWGSLHLVENTTLYAEYASPEFVKVYLQKGRARFQSKKTDGGGFEVVLGEEGEKWYSFNPKAKVRDLNTDFLVDAGETIKVHSISGQVAVGAVSKDKKNLASKKFEEKKGVHILNNGTIKDSPLPENGWWSNIDISYLEDDSLEKKKMLLNYNAIALKPIQKLGKVEMKIKDAFLPVLGFTDLQLTAKNESGGILESAYKVRITLNNARQLPFINIGTAEGNLDESGHFKSTITVDEPDPENFNSIDEIPMEASFVVQVLHPITMDESYREELSLPIGMALLYGQTIGPDYKARQQALPPEFKPTSFQIANQTDENGNFFVLFNTTLFQKDIEKFKKLADRTQQIFSMDQFGFSLLWSEACSLPLDYMLPDSVKNQLKAGQKVLIGKNGLIDLLSVEEQEQRIKLLMTAFIEKMPLKLEKKSYVLSNLDQLVFRYGVATASYPEFGDKLTSSQIIDIPLSREAFWSKEFFNGKESPPFNLLVHVMGHFLEHAICLEDARYYDFLSQNCAGNEDSWTHQLDIQKTIFDRSEYSSFSEAGADFFAYLLFHFIKQSETDLASRSIYFCPGYWPQFDNKDRVEASNKKYPPYAVSGVQTAFLVDYYGKKGFENPEKIFADFLLTKMLYAKHSRNGAPAMTINEWLLAKQYSFETEFLLSLPPPGFLAKEYGLIHEVAPISLLPLSNYQEAAIEINGKHFADFSQVPSACINPDSEVRVLNAPFKLLIPSKEVLHLVEMTPNSQFQIGADGSLQAVQGEFHFYSPLKFETALVSFFPYSTDFCVKFEPELINIEVIEGDLRLTSLKEEEIVLAGQSTSVNKKGKIKKPKKVKDPVEIQNVEKMKIPFLELE